MHDWWEQIVAQQPREHQIELGPFAAELTAALVFGGVVAVIYRYTVGRRAAQPSAMMATIMLLTVLMCMVTAVIGNSTARAFSLVGALAIVRFRTVVEDTRDTAFVIFAVAVGMALGAGYTVVPLIAIPFAAIAAFLFRPAADIAPVDGQYMLVIRVGAGIDPDAVLQSIFAKNLVQHRLVGTATARQGAALDVTYLVRLGSGVSAVSLVAQLNRSEGVQNVDLRQ